MIKIMKRQERILVIFVLFLSFCTIAICSKSSFLYPINDWGDANIYFIMSKGLLHGMVPYRDLYDQKGPFIFFIYLLGILINEKNFIGIFVLEVVAAFAFLFISYKMIRIYCKDLAAVLVLPFIAFSVYSSKAFCHGGSAEEFILPMYMFCFYKVLVFLETKQLRKKDAVLIGLVTGIIFWIKFPLVGLPIFLGIFVLAYYVKEKRFKEILKIFQKLTEGFSIPTCVVVLYYGLNKSLAYLWEGYFYNNIFLYTNMGDGKSAINYLWWYKLHIFDKNAYAVILMCVGILFLAYKRKYEHIILNIGVYLSIFIELYAGGNCYDYYPLVASICGVFGYVAIGKIASRLGAGVNLSKEGVLISFAALCIFSLFASWHNTTNRYLMLTDKSDTLQYQFADKMEKFGDKDKSLFIVGFMDEGFYLASGNMPDERFFCKTNIKFDKMINGQNEYIKEKKAKFIITKSVAELDHGNGEKRREYIKKCGYKEIEVKEAFFENFNQKYILFVRN